MGDWRSSDPEPRKLAIGFVQDHVQHDRILTLPVGRAGRFSDLLDAIERGETVVVIELADTAARTADRARALAAIATAVDVLDYTESTAAHHARLIADARRSATPPRRL